MFFAFGPISWTSLKRTRLIRIYIVRVYVMFVKFDNARFADLEIVALTI